MLLEENSQYIHKRSARRVFPVDSVIGQSSKGLYAVTVFKWVSGPPCKSSLHTPKERYKSDGQALTVGKFYGEFPFGGRSDQSQSEAFAGIIPHKVRTVQVTKYGRISGR